MKFQKISIPVFAGRILQSNIHKTFSTMFAAKSKHKK
jgi:hypothetical protein